MATAEPLVFHLHSAGRRGAFLHPQTAAKFVQLKLAGAFAEAARPGTVYAVANSSRVGLVVVPDGTEPLPGAVRPGTPWQHFGDFLRGAAPGAVAAPDPGEVPPAAPPPRVHPQRRRLLAQQTRPAPPPDPWDAFAAAGAGLLRGVPLPDHRPGEDPGWGEETTGAVPADLLALGRDAWALVALAAGALRGVFLPRWAARLLERHDGEEPWARLWSWVARRGTVLAFLELGHGCCYAFDLTSAESLRALYRTLAWSSAAPESFTVYRQHRVLGFAPQRIREAYGRAGNVRFQLDEALHESDHSLCGDARMLKELTRVDGFALDRSGWHRFFSEAPAGSPNHIRNLLPRLGTVPCFRAQATCTASSTPSSSAC